MREIRPYGSEGGAARKGRSYPYLGRWLFTRIPQELFERIIIGLALVATVTLFLPR